ncbi:NUDIX hydrolase domain-like protein [Aspergillus oleicola]
MTHSGYEVAHDLIEEFCAPLDCFRCKHPRYAHFVGGALIFRAAAELEPVRVLLLQRAEDDSYGNKWEFPGGKCEESDRTYLDGICRETWEETGLNISKFVGLVASREWQKDDGSYVVKFTFVVEVRELGSNVQPDNGIAPGLSEPSIKLDPKEHQAFVWATEEEVKASSDDGPGVFKSFKEQRAVILEGFKVQRGFIV